MNEPMIQSDPPLPGLLRWAVLIFSFFPLILCFQVARQMYRSGLSTYAYYTFAVAFLLIPLALLLSFGARRLILWTSRLWRRWGGSKCENNRGEEWVAHIGAFLLLAESLLLFHTLGVLLHENRTG